MGRIGITLLRWGELGLHYQDERNWDYIIKIGENWDYIIKMGRIGRSKNVAGVTPVI
jgi:hypothetical protein